MTRAELEAAFRRHMTELNIPFEFHNRLVDKFLPAADKYAVYVGSVTAERRAVLAGADPVIHYHLNENSVVSACGKVTAGHPGLLTFIAANVTCGGCKRTSLWRYQAGELP